MSRADTSLPTGQAASGRPPAAPTWWHGSTLARTTLTARVAEVEPVGLEVAYGSVWVADSGSGNVDQIDPRTGRLVARLHVSGLIVRLGAAFGSIWVNDDFGRVLRIKPQR